MKTKQLIYDCKTKEKRMEVIEINEVIDDLQNHTEQELTLEDKVLELEKANKEKDELINISLMATDEIYMMLEPLLVNTLSTNQVESISNLYVALVKRGLKDIKEVPERYREKAKSMLAQ